MFSVSVSSVRRSHAVSAERKYCPSSIVIWIKHTSYPLCIKCPAWLVHACSEFIIHAGSYSFNDYGPADYFIVLSRAYDTCFR